MPSPDPGVLHHVELWVADLDRTAASLGRLLERLGWTPHQHWDAGRSWRYGGTYVVVERSPAMTAGPYDRRRPGLNHLAFHAGPRADLDCLVDDLTAAGWTLLFADRHPYAGGPEHYAAYLEDADGLEVELVAADP